MNKTTIFTLFLATIALTSQGWAGGVGTKNSDNQITNQRDAFLDREVATLIEIRSLAMELVSRLPIFAKIVTHAKQQKRESKDICVVMKVLKSELRAFQQIHSDLHSAIEARRMYENSAEQRALIDSESIDELKGETEHYARIATSIEQRLSKLSELTDALAY